MRIQVISTCLQPATFDEIHRPDSRELCKKAAKMAQKNTEESPDEGFIASFAFAELKDVKNALEYFVHASMSSPHTARILLDMKKLDPKGYSEVSDHNSGVYLLSEIGSYFSNRSDEAERFFKALAKNKLFISLLQKVDKHAEFHSDRSKPDKDIGKNLKEWNEMRSREYASKKAKVILKSIDNPELGRVK